MPEDLTMVTIVISYSKFLHSLLVELVTLLFNRLLVKLLLVLRRNPSYYVWKYRHKKGKTFEESMAVLSATIDQSVVCELWVTSNSIKQKSLDIIRNEIYTISVHRLMKASRKSQMNKHTTSLYDLYSFSPPFSTSQ